MQAIVLVGGMGTRLRPLTEATPKQMLPVMGVPMIERVLEALRSHGVDRAVVSLGYLPDAFLDAYPNQVIGGVEVTFAIESEPLGTAGAIRFAAADAGIDETFLVVNGDILTDLDVSALVTMHRRLGLEGTIALTPVADPSAYGVVATDPTGIVEAFVEKPPAGTAPSNNINAGSYVLEPGFLARVPSSGAVSIEFDTFPLMVRDRALGAMLDTSYWLDAGTPQTYIQAHLDVLDGTHGLALPDPVVGGNLLREGARVEASAQVTASYVGPGAVVGDGASLTRCVVLDGATIEAGASVEGSIVGTCAVVGAGTSLAPITIVGPGATIAPGGFHENERIPA